MLTKTAIDTILQVDGKEPSHGARAQVSSYGMGIFYLRILTDVFVDAPSDLGELLAQFKKDTSLEIYSMTWVIQPSHVLGCWLMCDKDSPIKKDEF